MLKHNDIEQNSDEWNVMRRTRVTTSNFAKIMACGDKWGEQAKPYAESIAFARHTGREYRPSYKNKWMERGNELEPEAIDCYMVDQGFVTIRPGGFWCNDDIGVSPDILVDSDGLGEVKSVGNPAQYKRWSKGKYDTAYKWQIIGQLYYTGKEWTDFIQYCPTYMEGKELYIYRLFAKDFDDEFKQLQKKNGRVFSND